MPTDLAPESFPLSSAQLAAWRDLQLHPNPVIYSLWDTIRIDGSPDAARLIAAIKEVYASTANFRIRLVGDRFNPRQVFTPSIQVAVPLLDFTHECNPEGAAMEWMSRDHEKPFDFDGAPLFRNALLRISADTVIWYRNYLHLVADGFSMVLLAHWVSAAYKANDPGSVSALPHPPKQRADYRDYIRAEREYRQSEAYAADKQFWNSMYQEMPSPVSLSVRTSTKPAAQRRVRTAIFWLPHELLDSCYSLAAANGISTGQLLVGAIAIYVQRVTRAADISFCMTTHGRQPGTMMEMAGMCTNTVPLRFRFDIAASIGETLCNIARTITDALKHSRYRYEDLCADLDFGRSEPAPFRLHANVLRTGFQLKFTDRPVQVQAFATGPMDDLSFMLVENSKNQGHFRLGMTYNDALYELWEIESHKDYFVHVLEQLVTQPSRSLNEVSVITPAEQQRIVERWSQGERVEDSEACFHHRFEEQTARTPKHIAVEYRAERISYSELDRRANCLAHYLLANGVDRGELVGVCLDRSPAVIVALLAIQKAGAAYLPLEPDLPAVRLKYMVEDAGVACIVTHSAHELLLPDHLARLVFIDTMGEEISSHPPTPPEVAVCASDLAYAIYTSGSTGLPKGVLVQHDSLCNVARALADLFGMREQVRTLQYAKLSFDVSLGEIATALLSGATLVLADQSELLPATLGRTLADKEIAIATLPPAVLPSLREAELPLLETLAVGGDSLPADVASRWASRCRVINVYGPTETTVWSTAGTYDGAEVASIGRPLENTTIYILDEHGAPVAIGIPGELYIGGVGVARGYLNRPELTAEKFVSDTFSGDKQGRLYRTGDLARYLPDGNIEFLGRKDQQVKIRGFRIELGEIEAVLTGHEAVLESAVIVRETGARKQLVAYVVKRGGHDQVDSRELRNALRTQLPDYMVPAAVMFLEQLPRTSSGKLDRKALPPLETGALDLPFVAPETETERRLAKVWAEALAIDQVSANSNFVDAGGDSLAALNVMALVWSEFGIELSPQDIYETSTLSELSQRIESILIATT